MCGWALSALTGGAQNTETLPAVYQPFAPYLGTFVTPVSSDHAKVSKRIVTRTWYSKTWKAIEFESFVETDGRRVPHNNGMYKWNAETKRFDLTETYERQMISGYTTPGGNSLTDEWTSKRFDQPYGQGRNVSTVVDANTFTTDSFALKDGQWISTSHLVWKRE